MLDAAAARYAEKLYLAGDFLIRRGIDLDVAMDYQLGYVQDPASGHEKVAGRLAIPYVTPSGVVAMKFRCIADHDCGENGHAKYDAEAGQKLYLYGVLAFQADSEFICITEGELDVVACAQAGLPAVGVPGANNWRSWWRYCFDGYNDVIVLQDGDAPGEKLGRNVASNVYNARVVTMPPGEDVNSFLQKEGPDELRKRVGVA